MKKLRRSFFVTATVVAFISCQFLFSSTLPVSSNTQNPGTGSGWTLPGKKKAKKKAKASSSAVVSPQVVSCSTNTLTFDELPTQPVNGLSVEGVTFAFQIGGVASADALYNASGPGILTHVQDPSLEGNSFGTLTLTFTVPTPVLRFGIARNTLNTLMPGVTVDLSDAFLNPIGVISVDTNPLILFSEAQFAYSGSPVKRAVITFNSPASAERFVIDNLTYCADFDSCLQDETSGAVIKFNSFSGAYEYRDCQGLVLTGTGAVSRKGCIATLQHNAADRRVTARVDTCVKKGTAAVQLFSSGLTRTITDRDTSNNTCTCPGP